MSRNVANVKIEYKIYAYIVFIQDIYKLLDVPQKQSTKKRTVKI
jgi:hypothetical protein